MRRSLAAILFPLSFAGAAGGYRFRFLCVPRKLGEPGLVAGEETEGMAAEQSDVMGVEQQLSTEGVGLGFGEEPYQLPGQVGVESGIEFAHDEQTPRVSVRTTGPIMLNQVWVPLGSAP
jgi:hypothetical protein